MNATLKDIATRAHCSPATVSRAINGTAGVNSALLERIHAAMAELEARSAQKSDVDKALEKVNKTVAEQGKAISHIEKTYVEKDELQAVRKELREETRKLQADIEDIKENCLRKDDFLRQMMRLETMVTDINKYLREGR